MTGERPSFPVRNGADIDRLFFHLLTHWSLPLVEFRVEGLPSLSSQRAQDRFTRLADGCHCVIGELLGSITLLGGAFRIWTTSRSWGDLGLVLAITLYAFLAGKGIELIWTRVRMLRVLRWLQYQLLHGVDVPATTPVKAAAAMPPPMIVAAASAATHDEPRPFLPDESLRPRELLRNPADIQRLTRRLLTRWTLPRIEIQLESLPELVVQRAQDRLVRLSDGYSFLLAGVLTTLSLLAGLFYIVWTSSQDVTWTASKGWRDVSLVGVVTMYAGLLGAVLEIAWVRVRLLRVLRGLRRRLA